MSLNNQETLHKLNKVHLQSVLLEKQTKPSTSPDKSDQPNKNDQNHKEPDPKKTKPEIQKWY
jgi:hypothetical protein